MADTYRPPILATIFRGFGCVSFLGTVILLVVAVRLAGAAPDAEMSRGYIRPVAAPSWLAFLPVVSATLTTLVLFGIGELLDHIGQTAFFARKSFELQEHSATVYGSRWRDMQQTLEAVAANGKRAADNLIQSAAPAPSASRPTAPLSVQPVKRFFYMDADSQVAGPVRTSQLRTLFEGGTITDDTMVCPEGAEEWKPLVEIVVL